MRPDNLDGTASLVPGANKSGYIAALDGWRGLAILLVLVYHSLIHANLDGYHKLSRLLGLLEHLGPFGVLIFFMISGYLITGRLIADDKKTGRISLARFYYKRAFRILPLAYLYLILIGLAGALHLIVLKKPDWASVIFVTNYVVGRSWFTGHFWSLSIEEHFYLLWPPIIAMLGWRKASITGIGLVVAVGLWRPWVLHHTLNKAHDLQRTDMRLDYLMIGSLVAIGVVHWPQLRRFVASLGSGIGCICMILGLGLTLVNSPIDLRSLQALFLAGLVCGTALNTSAWIKKVLANRTILFFGKISYSIYILQQPFFAASDRAILNSPWIEAIKLPLVVGVAFLSYKYFEKPIIEFARRRLAIYDSQGRRAGNRLSLNWLVSPTAKLAVIVPD